MRCLAQRKTSGRRARSAHGDAGPLILEAIERVADRQGEIDAQARHRIVAAIEIVSFEAAQLVGGPRIAEDVETVEFLMNRDDLRGRAPADDAEVGARGQSAGDGREDLDRFPPLVLRGDETVVCLVDDDIAGQRRRRLLHARWVPDPFMEPVVLIRIDRCFARLVVPRPVARLRIERRVDIGPKV